MHRYYTDCRHKCQALYYDTWSMKNYLHLQFILLSCKKAGFTNKDIYCLGFKMDCKACWKVLYITGLLYLKERKRVCIFAKICQYLFFFFVKKKKKIFTFRYLVTTIIVCLFKSEKKKFKIQLSAISIQGINPGRNNNPWQSTGKGLWS